MTFNAVGRRFASTVSQSHHKVLVVGGGTGGLSVANQLYNRFKRDGRKIDDGDIAIVDAAEFHHYQPGWTLVGAGLKDKSTLRRRLSDLIPSHIAHHPESVSTFSPESSTLTTSSGTTLSYDYLIVAPGLQINWDAISNLSKALADPNSGVSSIYSYQTCDKAWADIASLRSGKAIFTQPAGVIKCAGAPQKIMWMAWDHYRRTNLSNKISIEFITGMPTMFSVPKYSEALNALRIKRGIEAKFSHNLTSIDPKARVATFSAPEGKTFETEYTILHVTPPQGPPSFIKNSPLADSAGWVDVDPASLRHKKFGNVFSLGDGSSLPTSKTAAAITAQAPVLVENLIKVIGSGDVNVNAKYDGYTSCPLLTGQKELMLAEFTYGLKPKESFASWWGIGDQAVPRRAFYHLKKDFFPWVYFNRMVKGEWYGPKGLSAPKF